MYKTEEYKKLFVEISQLYNESENKEKLLFHGWHHIKFVHDKAIEFAQYIEADVESVAVAALVHDLNYVFTDDLEPNAANHMIKKYIVEAGYEIKFANKIVEIVESAHTSTRNGKKLCLEAKALSDGDTLFKALPTTPILFSSKFISETGYSIEKLASKIIDDQKPLIENGNYFYTDEARSKYLDWATLNLKMWENLRESLQDESIKAMIDYARENNIV